MKKSSIIVFFGCSFAAAMAVAQEQRGFTIFDGGWRLSAGGVYDSGVKTKMGFSRSMATPTGARKTQDDAQKWGWGEEDGGKIIFHNTKHGDVESWVGEDTAYPQEDGGGFNYHMSKDVFSGSEFELGYAEYELGGDPLLRDNDESEMFGINVELSRNLYHNADDGWGIDCGFAVQYGRRNKAYRARSSWGGAGYYRSTYTPSDDVLECYNDESLYDLCWDGEGFAIGGGNIPFNASGLNRTETGPIEGGGGHYNAVGDYENLELMLLAHPYYDVYDWLRINGTLGVVVSRQSMEMSFSMFRDGELDYRSSRDFNEWDVYGVGGLGLMFYYKDFTLSADFMARFLDDEMNIRDRYYNGSVRRGHWMFRLSAGYEF